MAEVKDKKLSKDRSANFTTEEIQQLVALVSKHQNAINCNESGVKKGEIRKDAWEKITAEFNMNLVGKYRSAQVLKTKYKNIRSCSAKKFADVKANHRATGGGPPKPVVITEIDETIREIHGSQVVGNTSYYDDDMDEGDSPDEGGVTHMVTVEVHDVSEPFEVPPLPQKGQSSSWHTPKDVQKPVSVQLQNECQSSSWQSYTPKDLQKPVSAELQNKSTNRESVNCKIGKWANSKVELTGIQKECFLKKHKLEMDLMLQKHNKAVELMELESKERRAFAKEEHEAKMKILLEGNIPRQ